VSFAAGTVTVAGSYNVIGTTLIGGGTADFSTNSSTGSLILPGDTAVLQGSGTVTVTELLTWSRGTMRGTGTIVAEGGMVLDGADRYLDTRTLDNLGTATWAGGNYNMRLRNGAVVNNQPGAVWDFQNGAGVLNDDGSACAFNNQGTLKKSVSAYYYSATADWSLVCYSVHDLLD
jgi:hypothetical protein